MKPRTLLLSLLALVIALLAFLATIQDGDEPAAADSRDRPHLSRLAEKENLIEENASVDAWPDEGRGKWHVTNSAFYDPGVNRSGESGGSVRLETAVDDQGKCSYASVNSPPARVVPGRLYTYSAHLMSSTWPPPAVKFWYFIYYNEDITDFGEGQIQGSWHVPSDALVWNEAVGFFVAPPGAVWARVKIRLIRQPEDCACSASRRWLCAHPEKDCDVCARETRECAWPEHSGCVFSDDCCRFGPGHVWVDDLYLGEGIGFEQPPARKAVFEGDRVRVDGLGNMEVRRGGDWKDFFPFMIYPKNQGEAADYQRYADCGFNTVHQINAFGKPDPTQPETRQDQRAAWAANATSDLQPDGLMFSFSLGRQFNPKLNRDVFNPESLVRSVQELKGKPEMLDRLILYNWDDEGFSYGVAEEVITALRKEDPGAPVYSLNSREGLARMYHNDRVQLIDLSGEYLGNDEETGGGAGSLPHSLLVLDRLEGIRSPAFMMQLNGLTTSGNLRSRVYKGLILGARGLSVYADKRENPDDPSKSVPAIEDTLWLSELPFLREEIDALLPLIRQPHFTDWRLDLESPGSLVWGTRDDRDGRGHVLLANMSSTETAGVDLTPTGLDYRLGTVCDYFTGETAATVQDGSFTISLAAQGTAVLELLPVGLPCGGEPRLPASREGRHTSCVTNATG